MGGNFPFFESCWFHTSNQILNGVLDVCNDQNLVAAAEMIFKSDHSVAFFFEDQILPVLSIDGRLWFLRAIANKNYDLIDAFARHSKRRLSWCSVGHLGSKAAQNADIRMMRALEQCADHSICLRA
jgi:hypothetical protein